MHTLAKDWGWAVNVKMYIWIELKICYLVIKFCSILISRRKVMDSATFEYPKKAINSLKYVQKYYFYVKIKHRLINIF